MNQQTVELCLEVIKILDESIAKCEGRIAVYKEEKKEWKKRLKIARSRNHLKKK